MNYQNPIYGIFNEQIIQEQMRQQQLQQFHNDQMLKTFDCAQKLKEFLKSADNLAPQYWDMAVWQCCGVLNEHFMKRKTPVLY